MYDDWGKCHIIVWPWVAAAIINKRYDVYNTLIVESAVNHGEENGQPQYYCLIRSSKLPKGYHSVMEFVITAIDDYKLKPWRDVG